MAKNSKVQLVIDGKDNTKSAFESVDKGLLGISKSAVKAGAAIAGAFAVATAGVVTKLVKDSIEAADAMTKMASGAGVTTEALSGMAWGASQSGVELSALATAMGRLNKGALESTTGVGTYAKIFDQLGISASSSEGALKNADQLLLELADIFEAMPNGVEKSAFALELFGRSGAQMIPFLNAGAAGISELTAQAERLGLVLSTEQARASEEFNDNLAVLGATSAGVGNILAGELLPALNEFSGLLVDIAEDGESVNEMAVFMGSVMTGLAVAAIAVAAAFKTTGSAIGAVAAAVVALATGDFSGAKNIIEMGISDYEKNIKSASERIRKLTDGTYAEEGKARSAALREQRLLAEKEKSQNDRHYLELKQQQDKKIASDKQYHKDLLTEEKKYQKDLDKLKNKELEIEQRYNDTRDQLRGGAGGSEPSYAAASDLKLEARNLSQNGDFEGARKAAQKAQEMLLAMKEAGQNTYGLVGFADELERIEKQSIEAEKGLLENKMAGIKHEITLLKEDAKALESLPVAVELDQESVSTVKTQLQQAADEMRATAVIPFTVATGGQGTGDPSYPAFASGGHVRGAGTGTSDSIIARLSNGEYVMRAAAVRQYGTNLLDNMNGLKLPKFADGGAVGRVANMEPAGAKSIGTLNFNLPGGDSFSIDVAGTSSLDDLHRAALKYGRTRK